MTVENISWSISTKECCRPRRGLNPRPPGLQSDGTSNWATEADDNTSTKYSRYSVKTDCRSVWLTLVHQKLIFLRLAGQRFKRNKNILLHCISTLPYRFEFLTKSNIEIVWMYFCLPVVSGLLCQSDHIAALQRSQSVASLISLPLHVHCSIFPAQTIQEFMFFL